MFFGAVRGCVKSGGLNTHKVRFAHRAFILDGLYALYPEVLTLPFSVHIVNEMLRQNWNRSTVNARLFGRHSPREHTEARVKAREGPVLSTAYLMFLDTADALACFDNQLIVCTFVSPMTKTWSTGTLWPVFKYIQSQFGNLSSYTWNSPINSLCEFCLQMFLEPLVSKDTANNTHGAASPGGQWCVRWSFKVTAVSQMSS